MAIEIEVDMSSALSALGAIFNRVEERVKDALDQSAALVLNSARAGHPKVSDRIQGEAATPFREVSPASAGEFAGHYRFLTRTGILRNAIKIERAKRDGSGWRSDVFVAVRYADQVEYQGYPFMRPALETNRREITRRVAAAVRGGTGG